MSQRRVIKLTPNSTFSQPVRELVRKRISCRSFLDEPIADDIGQILTDFLSVGRPGPFGSTSRFEFVAPTTLNPEALKGLGTYGIIKGKPGYIVGATQHGANNLEDFGYLMEKAILYVTDLGLGTCWLGGTFTKSRFASKIHVAENESVPAITAVGHAAIKPGLLDSLIRRGAGSNERLPWERLFFDHTFDRPLSQSTAGAYAEPLTMVRLAPSASNRQPWRIVREREGWHFYLQRTKGYRDGAIMKIADIDDLQRIDMGIAMCHFELTALELGLAGQWKRRDPAINKPDALTEYVVTWTGG